MIAKSCASGSCGASSGAKIATTIQIAAIVSPISIVGWRHHERCFAAARVRLKRRSREGGRTACVVALMRAAPAGR